MALSVSSDREWIIRNAKGRRFVYESAEEAFGELHCRFMGGLDRRSC
ncbi:hypothetical protein ACIF8W_20140 [Streptomyces sp. NPDC085639]